MDYQPHVRFIYSHAEGVGGGDDTQLATDEILLDLFLGLWRQARMEVFGCRLIRLQELWQSLESVAAWRSKQWRRPVGAPVNVLQ